MRLYFVLFCFPIKSYTRKWINSAQFSVQSVPRLGIRSNPEIFRIICMFNFRKLKWYMYELEKNRLLIKNLNYIRTKRVPKQFIIRRFHTNLNESKKKGKFLPKKYETVVINQYFKFRSISKFGFRWRLINKQNMKLPI